ncbi:DUF4373 domain-containing protein [Sporolactobacillus sp. STSJ-5]|uniref:Lin1244/Lin1753 domain-containing protein n=1 Tax=Sporolactobacillus sp. STSJ-5 TaxID=2965076 RepID=UPI002103A707|nr:Lin1244/Lin1753 domain-containing protein [Sporolactobacillus sp. STSJ-5]MCQ2009228.1 DUF4373 domain-containing protein [Sporolactobacillus sp. STSJ-5]
MAKDAYYFSHDSNARYDPKILAMRSAFGMEGYGRYWCLIEILRDEDGYKLKKTKHLYDALAMQMQCERNAAHDFVDACINEFGLLHEDDEFIWSESLVNRMNHKDKKSEKARKAAQKRWQKVSSDAVSVHSDSDSNADAMQTHSERNALKESKGKESKEKDIKRNEEEATKDISVVDKLLKNNIISPAFITETLREDIDDICSNFGFDDPKEIIFYGIKVAVRGNGRTWKFIYNRLEYWRKQGVHTVADAEQLESGETSRRTHQIQRGRHGPQSQHQEVVPEFMKHPKKDKPPEDPEEVKRRAEKLEEFLNSI